MGLMLDGQTLYIADSFNHRVRKMDVSTGQTSLYYGDGTTATLNIPAGMTISGSYFYIAGAQSHKIFRLNHPAGTFNATAGDGVNGGRDGGLTEVRFWTPAGMISDSTNLWIPDNSGHRIRRLSLTWNGRTVTTTGNGNNANNLLMGGESNIASPGGLTTNGIFIVASSSSGNILRKIVENGLVGYWPLNTWQDETVAPATILDYASSIAALFNGSANNLTLASGPENNDTNGAMYFNGTSSYISIPSSGNWNFNFNVNFAISFWIKAPSTQNDTASTKNYILSKYAATAYPFIISIENQTSSLPGRITFTRFDGTNTPSISTGYAINDNNWHHIVAMKRGSAMTIFVDGFPAAAGNDTTSAVTTNVNPLIIGGESSTLKLFTGTIARVKIYNRPLTEGEIWGQSGKGGGLQNLIFKSNVAAGTISDIGPTGYALSVTGAPSAVNGRNGSPMSAFSYPSANYHSTTSTAGWPINDDPRTMCAYFTMNNFGPGNSYPAGYGTGANNFSLNISFLANAYNWGSAADGLDYVYTTRLNSGSWFFGCSVYDGTNIKSYLNGKLIGTTAAAIATASGNFYVGASPAGFFDGSIDEAKLFNVALTDNEIRKLSHQNPVGLYMAYDFNSDATDTGPFNFTSTISGAGYVADRFDATSSAYDFTGGSFSTPLNLNLNDNFTVTFWYKLAAGGTVADILAVGSAGTGVTLQRTNAGSFPLILSVPGATPATATSNHVPNDGWHFVSLRRSSGIFSLFVDGVTRTITNPTPLITPSGTLSIGATNTFPGQIDQLSVYARALLDAEITSLYNNATKRAFVTSVGTFGDFGSIVNADTWCNIDTDTPSTGYYRALISGTLRYACTSMNCGTSGIEEGLDWSLLPLTTYVRAATVNTLIHKTTQNAIFNFPLTNSFGTAGSYWTGTSSAWTASTVDCNDWTNILGMATYGDATVNTVNAIQQMPNPCTNTYMFLCIEQ